MFSEFLVFGTLWFWSAALITFFLVCLCISQEDLHEIIASGILLVFLCSLYFCGNSLFFNKCWVYLISHPLVFFGLVLGYFLIGTIWSVVKWYFFLLNKRDKFLEDKKQWDSSNHARPLFASVPEVRYYKKSILTWMTYWPFSMVWTLLDDPVRRAFNLIYYKIADFMQGISNRVFTPYVDPENK